MPVAGRPRSRSLIRAEIAAGHERARKIILDRSFDPQGQFVFRAAPICRILRAKTVTNMVALEPKTRVVFAAGACKNPGHPNAQAGVGCWFGPDSHLNRNHWLLRSEPQSAHRAALQAVITILKLLLHYPLEDTEKIVIAIDDARLHAIMTTPRLWHKALRMPGAEGVKFKDIQIMTNDLCMMGAYVKYWLISHISNVEASELAIAASVAVRP